MMNDAPARQTPGVYHRRVGDLVITVLSDGYLEGSLSALKNIEEEAARRLLVEAFRPVPRRSDVNCFIIRNGGRTALIDCGCANTMQPSAGTMLDNLAAAGIATKDIDIVLLTHLHPDHANALIDADGQRRFPNAELALHEAELAYWDDDRQAAIVADTKQGADYFAEARRQIGPYRDRLRLFRENEVFPGVTSVHMPGHTPGHSGFVVNSGKDSLLIWGDVVHVPEVQIPRPEVSHQFDSHPAIAAQTRRRVLDRAATDRQLVAGMHLHFPSFAHIVREKDSYRFLPEAWKVAL